MKLLNLLLLVSYEISNIYLPYAYSLDKFIRDHGASCCTKTLETNSLK